jgi:hypothetical protein
MNMKTKYRRISSGLASSLALTLTLAACGKPQQLDLIGIKYGMTLDEVKEASPDGASLYCQGDGDSAFDAKFPKSDTTTYCAWTSTDAAGGRTYTSSISFGDSKAFDNQFAFSHVGGRYALDMFKIRFRENAYQPNVQILTDRLGKPEPSPMNVPFLVDGVQWAGTNATLTSWVEHQPTGYPPLSGLILTKTVSKPG